MHTHRLVVMDDGQKGIASIPVLYTFPQIVTLRAGRLAWPTRKKQTSTNLEKKNY